MASPIHKKLMQSLAPLKARMDEEALSITEELISKFYPFTIITSTQAISDFEDAPGEFIYTRHFKSARGEAIVASFTIPKGEFIRDQEEELRKCQFRTQEENNLYCQGTKDLLSLLTRFCYHRTEKTTIMAFPDARCSKGPVNGLVESYIEKDHLSQIYNDKRQVSVVIVTDNGIIALSFKEKIKEK